MDHSSQAQEAFAAQSSSPDYSASLPSSPSSSSSVSTLTPSQHPQDTDSRPDQSLSPTLQLIIDSGELQQLRQQEHGVPTPGFDVGSSVEMDWPSPTANCVLIEPVDRLEHEKLVMKVRGQVKRTVRLSRDSRRGVLQRRMAHRQIRRRLRAMRGDIHQVEDSVQDMQSWAYAMNSALQPLLLERLGKANEEEERDDIEQLLEMVDEGYPGA